MERARNATKLAGRALSGRIPVGIRPESIMARNAKRAKHIQRMVESKRYKTEHGALKPPGTKSEMI